MAEVSPHKGLFSASFPGAKGLKCPTIGIIVQKMGIYGYCWRKSASYILKKQSKKYPNKARFSLSFPSPVELVEHLPHSPMGQATLALPAAVGVRTSPWSRGKSIGLDLNGLLILNLYVYTYAFVFFFVYIVKSIDLWMCLYVCILHMHACIRAQLKKSKRYGMTSQIPERHR